MPINPDAVGTKSDPIRRKWDSKDALIYALGVGAGAADPLDELQFTTENTSEKPQRVLPTAAVVLGPLGGAMGAIGTFNPAMLVHGEQGITLHREIPVEGELEAVGEITGIYDKGKGAVVAMATTCTLASTGEPLFDLRMSAFIRGEGGWGGDRGPSGPQNVPPSASPDQQVTYQTSPDQALLYRLSGDRNPLHSDPSFAKQGGFDAPILHGLCTYGFTGRALLHTLAGGDPAHFHHIEGRVSSPVIPGEALTISIWNTEPGEAVFTTSVGDRVVLDQGLVRFS